MCSLFHISPDSPKFRVTRARIQSRSQQKALEVLQESTQHLVIDRERLVRLLDTTVELTEDYTVSRLEKLHSIFSQSIYQHRLDVDKTQMIQVGVYGFIYSFGPMGPGTHWISYHCVQMHFMSPDHYFAWQV